MSAFTEPKFAWEPITPRGVAAFARASFERLFIVQAICAVIAAAAVVWFLHDGIFPVIDNAVNALPAAGEIRNGKLDWRGDSPVLLGEDNLLALMVDLQHGGTIRSPADFQFEFGTDSIRVLTLFGETEFDYPRLAPFAVNKPEARPAWGAWSPEILGLIALGTFFGLLFVWALLATLYFLPVWLFCFFANRDLNFRESWKLAAAALLPGALLLSLAIVLYDVAAFDLVQLCFAFGMHLLIGWLYLFVSPMFLNRALPKEPGNPFAEKE